MNAKIIKTEEEYEAMLARVERLMDAAQGSDEEAELELLGLLIEKYEDEIYPVDLPNPIEAIKFFMDQKGLSNADMMPYLGVASKVSEVLNGRRPLSKNMIKKLVEGLGIPAEILLETAASTKKTVVSSGNDQDYMCGGSFERISTMETYETSVCWQRFPIGESITGICPSAA